MAPWVFFFATPDTITFALNAPVNAFGIDVSDLGTVGATDFSATLSKTAGARTVKVDSPVLCGAGFQPAAGLQPAFAHWRRSRRPVGNRPQVENLAHKGTRALRTGYARIRAFAQIALPRALRVAHLERSTMTSSAITRAPLMAGSFALRNQRQPRFNLGDLLGHGRRRRNLL